MKICQTILLINKETMVETMPINENTHEGKEKNEKTNHQKMNVLVEKMDEKSFTIGNRKLEWKKISEEFGKWWIELTISRKHNDQERYRSYQILSFPDTNISYSIEWKTQYNEWVSKEIDNFIINFEHYLNQALIKEKQDSLDKN